MQYIKDLFTIWKQGTEILNLLRGLKRTMKMSRISRDRKEFYITQIDKYI